MRRRRGIMGLNGGAGIPIIIATATGNPLTFETDLAKPLKRLVIPFTPIQEGSGDPSPTNVRPISGWTGANVFGSNGNLICAPQDGWYQTFIPAGTPVSASMEDNIQGRIDYYRKDKTQIDYWTLNVPSGNRYGRTFAVIEDTYFVKFTHETNAVVRRGNNLYDYCQYANILPINWQSSAGTIYGGTVTLNEDGSADVVADMASVIITSVSSYPYRTLNSAYFVPTPTMASGNGMNGYASWLPTTINQEKDYPSVQFGWNDNPNRIYLWRIGYVVAQSLGISDVRDVTATQVNQYLEDHPLQVAYQLATPQTYHFDNIGQLITFIGTNTIWTDTNGTNTATYLKHQS